MYERVKYKDDGRELVGFIEFVTIHCTFSILNAWISYQLAYQFMIMLSSSCPYKVDHSDNYFCKESNNVSKDAYYYTLFLEPAKIIYCLILLENVMYLAYYKDVIFGLCCCIIFGGIFGNSTDIDTS